MLRKISFPDSCRQIKIDLNQPKYKGAFSTIYEGGDLKSAEVVNIRRINISHLIKKCNGNKLI